MIDRDSTPLSSKYPRSKNQCTSSWMAVFGPICFLGLLRLRSWIRMVGKYLIGGIVMDRLLGNKTRFLACFCRLQYWCNAAIALLYHIVGLATYSTGANSCKFASP
ncbi:hypothetical protein JAAARDRAFT_406266 [Jaapia argillacea MUCL 33604]|uniref:Uncharacterized protein n=1 Tax=Jaapia argillacea MUCL 33604 TaxID=933084 RepID=A0A067PVL2_9AGAM|nr:hypothetical protein JAAARDRAFT_406266 [Jaapia argillacea MUCL 33604]